MSIDTMPWHVINKQEYQSVCPFSTLLSKGMGEPSHSRKKAVTWECTKSDGIQPRLEPQPCTESHGKHHVGRDFWALSWKIMVGIGMCKAQKSQMGNCGRRLRKSYMEGCVKKRDSGAGEVSWVLAMKNQKCQAREYGLLQILWSLINILTQRIPPSFKPRT